MPPPHLGVDFGTSHTVAVLRRSDGRVEPLLFDGTPLLPSAVFADASGVLGVGADAVDAARSEPHRCEPHPKRRIDDGTVLLGEREFAVAELFGAVLARVRNRCAEVDRAVPEAVTLTHPAAWGPARRQVLRAAAEAAGFRGARLMPEPVSAATYYVRHLGVDVPVGATLAVHDFGGGTFDAAVVRRTSGGFEVLAVDGLDDLGGVDIDELIVGHLRGQVEAPWDRLLDPPTAADRRRAWRFREDVRLAKERLSRRTVAEVHVPFADVDVHVTRGELERLVSPLLERAVTVTRAVLAEAGVTGRVAQVLLVGGGSRMPLVATMLHRELGCAPMLTDDIERVVAHGAIIVEPSPAGPIALPAPPPHRWSPPEPSRPPRAVIREPSFEINPEPIPSTVGHRVELPTLDEEARNVNRGQLVVVWSLALAGLLLIVLVVAFG